MQNDLISRNALIADFLQYVRTEPHMHYGDWDKMCVSGAEIDEVIANTPTIDAVEVVRCRECKYARPLVQEEWVECIMWFRGSLVDGFCHMGAMMDAQDMDVHAKDGGAEG